MKTSRRIAAEPIRIGNMRVKNRFVMAPMNTNYSDINGCITPQMEQYYIRRAQGGVGLIILEAVSVSPDSKNHGVQPMLYDEKFVPAWSNLIEQLQSYGTKVSIEIAHFGSEAMLHPRVSPSEVSRFAGATVKSLSKEEIKELQKNFVMTISNARKAGADAVTLHGAHGYLIAEFMSPLYNRRPDEYGGSIENRLRFLTEIIQMAKKEVGQAFPIMVRYSVNEYARGGRTIEESVEIAKLLEQAGAAAIDLSAGIPNAYIFTNPPNGLGDTSCMLVPYAERVKKEISIPVLCANTIRKYEEIEDILTMKKADMVSLARPMLADPDFCNKILDGQEEDIRQCLSCQHCFRTLDSGASLRCAVNAETGREYMYPPLDKDKAKKIVIVGGGPAGMEAARIASAKGHKVVLFEKEQELGGSLIPAAIPPNKEKIQWLIDWYRHQLAEEKVDIRCESLPTKEQIIELAPDAVVIAAGASYIRRIPGSEAQGIITAVEALKNPALAGQKIVIIGGGATGCETAEYFAGEKVSLQFTEVNGVAGELLFERSICEDAEQGKQIEIVEMLDEIASDMDEFNKQLMRIVLPEKGVKLSASTMVQKIDQGFVHVLNLRNNEQRAIEADTVILAGGLVPAHIFEVGELEVPVYYIGDSNKPGRIADALYSAYAAARRL